MRAVVFALAVMLAVAPAPAQRHKLGMINAETPEGQLLQQIGQESDGTKKLGLLEQFAAKFPKHEANGWVYSQMHPAYMKAGQFDKAIDIGEKLLALDPDDVESAHQSLKAAEAKKDPALIQKWSDRTSQIARKVAATPKPKDEDEVEAWSQRVDFAKQVDIYTEYSLYAAALQATDPAAKSVLMTALEQRNPKNQYLPELRRQVFLGYRQAGDAEKAVEMAEKIFATDRSDEDMLLVAADYYMQKKKDPDKVLLYAGRLVEVMSAKPKPQGVSDADWDKKRNLTLGLGHWWTGVTLAGQNKFAPADKSLRAALPFIKDNEQLLAGALFYLGLANYRLGDAGKGDEARLLDAVRFNQQCAAIRGPYQAQAQKNLKVIQTKYRVK